MTQPTLQEATDRLTPLFAGRTEVLAAYIFGSLASGRTRPNSDIDVAVLLDQAAMKHAPLSYRADLIAEAGAELETFEVDVVILNNAPPALAHNVITKGKLIFERSRSARIAFQVRNLNRFLDLEPMHRIQVGYMKKRYS
jgi:predicted nucleotidyltransferase